MYSYYKGIRINIHLKSALDTLILAIIHNNGRGVQKVSRLIYNMHAMSNELLIQTVMA